jgi:ABC-type branched-subunit amino acid transport system ATPase component/branched-subunit amino acid ABC-type transport system permease component
VNQFLEEALLGLGSGAIYGLLAQGLVVVYRGSGVLNFAQGAFAMAGAYLFYELNTVAGWPVYLSILTAVALMGILGAVVQLLIMNPMRNSAALSRVIATLGILLAVEAFAEIRFTTNTTEVTSYLPTSTLRLTDGLYIGKDKLIILAAGIVVTSVLWAVYRFTQFGRATQAVAEAPRVAAILGYSPNRIAAVNWAIGASLAALAGCLIAPLTGLQVANLTNLVIPAIVVAVLAQLRSFPLALLAGLFVGITSSEVTNYVSAPGWGDAVPFILLMALLVARGTSLPLRDFTHQRLPAVASGNFRRRYLLLVLAALLLVVEFGSSEWRQAMLTTALAAIVGLSVVVVTGYCGQISLAPYGFAAVGGVVAAQLAHYTGMSLVPALVLGVGAATIAGAIVALPAIRTRGMNLAIVSLGFGVVVSEVVLQNYSWSGGEFGITIANVSLFGWDVTSTAHLARYTALVVVVLVGMILLAINLRRGASGRKMIAVRDNERAAASLGVSVASTKLAAFAIAAGIAAVGGVLTVFQFTDASFSYGFDDLSSITIVAFVVLGGLGYTSGAVFGALLVGGGLFAQVLSGWSSINEYLPLIGGLGIIVQLIVAPDGTMPLNFASARSLFRRPAKPALEDELSIAITSADVRASEEGAKASPSNLRTVSAQKLEVRGLHVSFGATVAVDDVSFDISPGEVVGLIGPNGAGKTTVIDAITGFVKSEGTVTLGDRRIDRNRASARAAHGIARSFQSIELFDDLTVRENLAVACEPWIALSPIRDMVAPRAIRLSDTALAAIDDFNLQSILDRKPAELPFAKRRLIGIARSVARAPSVLLLDEPGAGLDSLEVDELSALVRALASKWGMGILLVEHHLEMVASTCDRLVVLDRGNILATGTPQEMLSDERVREAYTGVGVVDKSDQGEHASIGNDQ